MYPYSFTFFNVDFIFFLVDFAAVDGRIVPLDGDSYSLEEEVIESYEWNDPDEGIENGFLVVVIGDVMRMNYKR
jgi:hypothetical protein